MPLLLSVVLGVLLAAAGPAAAVATGTAAPAVTALGKGWCC